MGNFLRRLVRGLGLSRTLSRIVDGGHGEKRVIATLKIHVRPGDIVWDVGANRGHYSSFFREMVGESGSVYAFEPHPSTYEKLVVATDFENVFCLNLGLSDQPGEAFLSQEADSANNSFVRHDSEVASISVPVTTGDKFLKTSGTPVPCGVKIDVEGHESKVLRGMDGILKEESLKFLVIEIHRTILEKSESPRAVRDIRRHLASRGFKVKWIDSSHLLASR